VEKTHPRVLILEAGLVIVNASVIDEGCISLPFLYLTHRGAHLENKYIRGAFSLSSPLEVEVCVGFSCYVPLHYLT